MNLNWKAISKPLAVFVGTLVAIGVQYLLTGEFDRQVVATAATGFSAAVLSFLIPTDTTGNREFDSIPVSAMSSSQDKRV